MTPERKRALLTMGATLVIGIIVGVLATGIFARQFYHGREGKRGGGREMREGRRGTFSDKIFRVVKADSSQRKEIKPIIEQTMARLDEIEEKSNNDAYAQLDSLKVKLRPILAAEQMEKLEKFLLAKKTAHEQEEKREHEQEHDHR